MRADPPEGQTGTCSSHAKLKDTPGYGTAPSWNVFWGTIQEMEQKFQSCAICEDPYSCSYNEVFGCISWSHVVQLDVGEGLWYKYYSIGAFGEIAYGESLPQSTVDAEWSRPLQVAPRAGVAPSGPFLRVFNSPSGIIDEILGGSGKGYFW